MSTLKLIQDFCELISDDPEFSGYYELLKILSSDPSHSKKIEKFMTNFEGTDFIKTAKSRLLASRKVAMEKIRQFEIETGKRLSDVNEAVENNKIRIQESINELDIEMLKDLARRQGNEIMQPFLDQVEIKDGLFPKGGKGK